MSNNTKQCKVKVRKVHDETISTLTGNMYFLTLNNDYTGYIIFTTIDTNANVVSIPYEVIVKVAFKANFIKLMLDANNLKGPGIELEFYDTTKFENVKGQITHYIALCRENKKSKRNIIVHENNNNNTFGSNAASSSMMQTGTSNAPIDVDNDNNNPLSFDKQKAYLLLQNNPEMMSLYKQLVPPLEPHEFWDNQTRKNQVAVGLQAGETLSVGQTQEDTIKVDRRGNKTINLTQNHMGHILRTRPVVAKAYKKYVQEKKIINTSDFFITLSLNDQYRQGEIDDSLLTNIGTNQQIFIDIEEEEKRLHLHNRNERLKSADPLFDLRSTHSEVLRGPTSAKEGYGIIDRSLKRVENVDIECDGNNNNNNSNNNEKDESEYENDKKRSIYSVQQFNQQGDRILNDNNYSSSSSSSSLSNNNSNNTRTTINNPTMHPDLISSSSMSQHRKVLPLALGGGNNNNNNNNNDTDEGRPIKRLKSEENNLLEEIKQQLENYKYAPKRAFKTISRPPTYDLKYIKGKKDYSSGLMSQIPKHWLKESKGKGVSSSSNRTDRKYWVYLRKLQNIDGSTINYFDQQQINPIRSWNEFKVYRNRKDLFWSRYDLKNLFAHGRVGKELLVFFWSHLNNKHSVGKLKQIVQKIENNINEIRNLGNLVNDNAKEKMIQPLEYAIRRYKEKYEKKKKKNNNNNMMNVVKSEVGSGGAGGKRKRE